eukprot:CAMPEP_0171781674 /NCGR_PEP_ID=MMETSP0991-20121206/60378_1 /TAXON_ID=483369 /ORGANISM="non described non described, Strain CCMP2098" /LENGTH=92 /DNA_ID=CAMNT_0012389345 /DNA_START=262 /DNA_END=537 /DNA_ORIENTATION=-
MRLARAAKWLETKHKRVVWSSVKATAAAPLFPSTCANPVASVAVATSEVLALARSPRITNTTKISHSDSFATTANPFPTPASLAAAARNCCC